MKPKFSSRLAATFPTRLILSCGLAVSGFASQSVQATTWSGLGADANWATPNNWDVTPSNSFNAALVFTGSTQASNYNNLTGGTATSMTFSAGAGAFVLSGNAITVGDITNSSTNPQTINLAMVTSAQRNVTSTAGGGNLTLGGTLSGPGGGINTVGTGTITLAGNNAYAFNTLVNAGTFNVSGAINSPAATLTIGEQLATNKAVVNVTGSVTEYQLYAGTSGASGALNLKPGGLISIVGPDGENSFNMGVNTNTYGYFNNSGGTLSSTRVTFGNQASSGQNNGTGVGLMSAGTINSTTYFIISRANGSIGEFTLSGGVINRSSTGSGQTLALGWDAAGGRAELNVLGGLINNSGAGGVVNYGNNVGTVTGILNLNGGTLRTNSFTKVATATAYLNLGGGTLQASSSSTTFLPALTAVYVNGAFGAFAGGALIDTNGNNDTIVAPLLAPTGSGLATLPMTTQGSGYIGAPHITISGTGTGATAIANMVDDGAGALKVGSITITNPGVGYTGTPTFALSGGGPGTAATVGTATIAPNTSGGLTKIGAGTLTLSGANTYTGATTVNGGTLSLTGNSSISGATTINSGTLQLGNGTSGSLGATTLTFNGGNFIYQGLTAGGTQTLAALTFNAGEGTVQSTYGTSGTTTLGFASLTARTAGGGTGNFVTSGGTNGTTNRINFTSAPTAGTLIDRGLFFSGSSYAAYDPGGFVRAYGSSDAGYVAAAAGSNTIISGSSTNVALGGSVTAQAAATIHSLNLGANSLALGAVAFQTDGILQSGGAASAISGGTSLSSATASGELVVRSNLATDALGISTPIVDNATATALTLSGAGKLTLSASNTYTGTTTINSGSLQLSGSVGTLSTSSAIVNNGNFTINRSNAVAQGTDFSAAAITGTGSLTQAGSGTLTLSGGNTYAGTTTITAGSLKLGSSAALPGNALAVNAGTLDLAGCSAATTSLSGSGVISNSTGTDSTFSINLGNSVANAFNGTITTPSAGKLNIILNASAGGSSSNVSFNSANTFKGAITVNGTGSTSGSNGLLGVPNGAGDASNVITLTNGGGLTSLYNPTATGGWSSFNGTVLANPIILSGTVGGVIRQGFTNLITLNGIISGTALTKTDSGALTLSGASSNTYTGTTTVTGGNLILSKTGGATAIPGNLAIGGAGNNNVYVWGTANNQLGGANTVVSSVNATGINAFNLLGLTQTVAGLNSPGGGLMVDNSSAAGSSALTGTVILTGTGSYLDAGWIWDNWSGTGSTGKVALTVNMGGGGVQILSGGNITYTGATTVNAGTLMLSDTTAFASAITNSSTVAFNAASGFTLGASVPLAGAGTYNKIGAGTLTLSGANTYTGTTTLSAGTLALGSGGAIGSTGNIGFSGGTLQFSASNTTDYSARISSGTSASAVAIDTNSQTVTFATGFSSGQSGGLTKLGAGTLTLSGASSNTGTTTVAAGTLKLGNSSALSTGNLAVNAGTLDLAGFNTATTLLSGNGTISNSSAVDSTVTLNLGASIADGFTGAITTPSTGKVNFVFNSTAGGTSSNVSINSASTFKGAVTVNGTGTTTGFTSMLGVGANPSLGDVTNVITLNNGGGLTEMSNPTATGGWPTHGNLTFANPIVLAGTTGGVIRVGFTDVLTLSGVISGSAGLTKTDSGTLLLTGNNTYLGDTTLMGGVLALGSSGAIATTGNIIFAGGTLQFSASNLTDYSPRIDSGSSTGAVAIDTNAQNVTFANGLSATKSGGLTKLGGGTLTLSGSNAYTGGTIVNAGTLIAGSATALGDSASSVSVASGAVLDLNGQTLTNTNTLLLNGTGTSSGGALTNSNATAATYAGQIALAGSSSIVAATGELVLSNTGTITGAGFGLTLGGSNNGSITGNIATGAGSLTKTGSGSWTLSGTNTYTGATTISAGTLKLGGSSALASGPLNVPAGILDLAGFNAATSQLAGSGTITNSSTADSTLTINLAASIAAGFSDTIATPSTGMLNLVFNTTAGGSSSNASMNVASTFKGAITVNGTGSTTGNASVLGVGNNSSLGDPTNVLTLNNGGGLTSLVNPTNAGAWSSNSGITLANPIVLAGTAGGVFRQGFTNLMTLSGGISGSADLTKTDSGTLVVSGVTTYTGNTSVMGGTLSITSNSATTFAATSTVSIATGAVLNLPNAATHIVASLVINGVVLPSGLYDASSLATTGFITGSGQLQVAAPSGYASWAALHVAGNPANAYTNNDGVPNGVAYFMNATAGFSANPSVVTVGTVRSVTWPNGGNIPFTAYGTQFVVQTSADLTTWTDIPSADANLSNTSGEVAYTLPTGAGAIFVRLTVTPN